MLSLHENIMCPDGQSETKPSYTNQVYRAAMPKVFPKLKYLDNESIPSCTKEETKNMAAVEKRDVNVGKSSKKVGNISISTYVKKKKKKIAEKTTMKRVWSFFTKLQKKFTKQEEKTIAETKVDKVKWFLFDEPIYIYPSLKW